MVPEPGTEFKGIFAIILAGTLAFDGKLSSFDGVIMLTAFIVWLIHVTKENKDHKDEDEKETFHIGQGVPKKKQPATEQSKYFKK